MKRAIKRYKSEEIIILEMSLCKTRSLSLQKEAERIEAEIEVLKKSPLNAELVAYNRKEADRCRKLAASLIDNRLQMLKRTLAVFRTPQLAALDNGGPSVPACR